MAIWRHGWTLGEGVIFQGSFTSVSDHQLHSELNARIQLSAFIVNMNFALLFSLCSFAVTDMLLLLLLSHFSRVRLCATP